MRAALFACAMLASAMTVTPVQAALADDRKTVAALDVRYQAAVKANDAETMAAILADDMVLVVGRGDVVTRADLLDGARARSVIYEQQDEEPHERLGRLLHLPLTGTCGSARRPGPRRGGPSA